MRRVRYPSSVKESCLRVQHLSAQTPVVEHFWRHARGTLALAVANPHGSGQLPLSASGLGSRHQGNGHVLRPSLLGFLDRFIKPMLSGQQIMRSKVGVSAHVHVGSIQATNPLVPMERPKVHHVTADAAVSCHRTRSNDNCTKPSTYRSA